jgi:hypothetical protein
MRRVECVSRHRRRGGGTRHDVDVVENGVLDQQMPLRVHAALQHVVAQVRTDRDDGIGLAQATVLEPAKQADEQARTRELEIAQLLRQARMHVVDEPKTEQRLERTAPEDRLLVRMDHGIAMPRHHADGPEDHQHIEHELLPRRPDGNGLECANRRDAHDPHARNVDILSAAVGQQVDLDALLGRDERAVVHAERRPARREERMRSNDEHLHRVANLCSWLLVFIPT